MTDFSTPTPPTQPGGKTMVPRHGLVRILWGILWFLPIYLLASMVLGGIIGALAVGDGAGVGGFQEGYAAGGNASRAFFAKYGGLFFISQVILVGVLTYLGQLPGTAKMKKG